MKPVDFLRTAITPAASLLPAKLDTPQARAMVIAIALQETGLRARRQMQNGPARSFVQFEIATIRNVLEHPAAKRLSWDFRGALDYVSAIYTPDVLLAATEFDSVLAAGLARLALYVDPAPLPFADQDSVAWAYYLRVWRPGKPRPADWSPCWRQAWETVGYVD